MSNLQGARAADDRWIVKEVFARWSLYLNRSRGQRSSGCRIDRGPVTTIFPHDLPRVLGQPEKNRVCQCKCKCSQPLPGERCVPTTECGHCRRTVCMRCLHFAMAAYVGCHKCCGDGVCK
jgi:hypothetical protein